MVVRLVTPGGREKKLTLTTDHPGSHYGLGVLLTPRGEILDGGHFRFLRDCLGSTIVSNDPSAVARALGVPVGEAGLVVG